MNHYAASLRMERGYVTAFGDGPPALLIVCGLFISLIKICCLRIIHLAHLSDTVRPPRGGGHEERDKIHCVNLQFGTMTQGKNLPQQNHISPLLFSFN